MASRISKIWNLSRPWKRVRATPSTCCKTILNSMIGQISPRIRDRPPVSLFQLIWRRRWLLVGVVWGAAAIAAPPAPAPPTPPVSSSGAPDDDFIEFLGADDMGDAAWWEFLKNVPPRGE